MDSITNIAITVTAIDSDGKPVYAVAEYYNPRGWIAGRPEFQGWFKKKACYPRILRGKFGDQFRFFKVPNDSGLAHPSMPGNEQDGKAKDEPVTARRCSCWTLITSTWCTTSRSWSRRCEQINGEKRFNNIKVTSMRACCAVT
jgi:hypothetical protein